MNRFVSWLFSKVEARGGGLILRQLWIRPRDAGRWLSRLAWASVPASVLREDERVVIVGIGVSSFSFLKQMRTYGHRRLTVVSKDDLYGGKCVNVGCMPLEYLYSLPPDSANPRERTAKFVADLRAVVAGQMRASDLHARRGEAVSVQGNVLRLADGSSIEFDRLIWAAGNEPMRPARWAESVPLQDLWTREPGPLVLVAEAEPNALAYAEWARELGHDVTLLWTKAPLFRDLPSFRFYRETIAARGVKIFDKVILQGVRNGVFHWRAKGYDHAADFSTLIEVIPVVPRMPVVDGRLAHISEVDLRRGSLVRRPDVFFLGDAGGYLSAAESELQAYLLAESLSTGAELDLGALQHLPLRLHGRRSWASAGGPTSFVGGGWEELDFAELGWSMAHASGGKLWYRWRPESGMVEAIQICHAHASELIAMADVLMAKPVTDVLWLASQVHPSAAEIFPLLAKRLRARMGVKAQGDRRTDRIRAVPLRLDIDAPDWRVLGRGGPFPSWLRADDFREAVLHRDFERRLALIFARSALQDSLRQRGEAVVVTDGRWEFEESTGTLHLDWNGHRVTVRGGEQHGKSL